MHLGKYFLIHIVVALMHIANNAVNASDKAAQDTSSS